jgi:predicted enzyme related to lactoylglutathione lyase
MLKDSYAFSGYSVDDMDKARDFYGATLGITLEPNDMGMLHLKFPNGQLVMIYPKPDHQAASFTVLNFPVPDVEAAVDELTAKGVAFEHYDSEWIRTDAKGIARPPKPEDGPVIAWFKDPAGNILSVLETE